MSGEALFKSIVSGENQSIDVYKRQVQYIVYDYVFFEALFIVNL